MRQQYREKKEFLELRCARANLILKRETRYEQYVRYFLRDRVIKKEKGREDGESVLISNSSFDSSRSINKLLNYTRTYIEAQFLQFPLAL